MHPCWRNLGGTFHGTFWRPKTDLLQRTIKSPKGILPRNLFYGLRPQSRCRWVESRRYLPGNCGKDYWWEISRTRLLRDCVQRYVWDILEANQLANQPKRFRRKISGRYVPKVFLFFLQNFLQKVCETVLDRKILSDLLRDMFERMFWVIRVSRQICAWHNFGGLVSKDVFTNSSRRYISQVARTIPGAWFPLLFYGPTFVFILMLHISQKLLGFFVGFFSARYLVRDIFLNIPWTLGTLQQKDWTVNKDVWDKHPCSHVFCGVSPTNTSQESLGYVFAKHTNYTSKDVGNIKRKHSFTHFLGRKKEYLSQLFSEKVIWLYLKPFLRDTLHK